MPFAAEPIAHAVMEVPKGDKPGEGEELDFGDADEG